MGQEPDRAIAPSELRSAVDDASAKPGLAWPQVWGLILTLAVVCSALMAARHQTGLFIPILAFIVCMVAAWYDAATAHIPNPLTYTAILLGLGLNATASLPGMTAAAQWLGTVGVFDALAGFGLCASIGLACMLVAGMGGGDMKVLAALGALLGFNASATVLIVALAVATVYAVVNLIVAGQLNRVVGFLSLQLLELVYLQRTDAVVAVSKKSIPLAVPLVLGLLLSRVGHALGWTFWPFGSN